MDEFHSDSTKNSHNRFVSNNSLLSLTATSNLSVKRNNQIHSNPIYIYDAPNGLGLAILQAIFQVVINPFHSSLIYSAYILPDNLNRIFFEAMDLKSVRKTLRYISDIGSIPKNLPVVRNDQIYQYFINPISCLHFHPGQIVTIHNPEFDKQLGQIIDIKKDSGKILIKTYPRIDYALLRSDKNISLQSQLNMSMDPSYHAPMVPFHKEGLVTTNSSIPIWNSQVNVIKWDNKYFIGKFQYLWLNYKELTHKNRSQMNAEEIKVFDDGISLYEKMNSAFLNGFYEKLNFEGTHDSDSILTLSLNKGTPSWAHKKTLDFNLSSSDSSSDSENKSSTSNSLSKSQPQKKLHFLEKEVFSSLNKNDHNSQKTNPQTESISSINNEDSNVFPSLPDIDYDDDNNNESDNDDNKSVKENKNKSKKDISRTYSPIYVGSSSSSDEEKNASQSKGNNDKKIAFSQPNVDIFSKSFLDTSSDSDVDALFDYNSSKKKKDASKEKDSSKKDKNNVKDKKSSKKGREKSKPINKSSSKTDKIKSSIDLSNIFSSDLDSDNVVDTNKPSSIKQKSKSQARKSLQEETVNKKVSNHKNKKDSNIKEKHKNAPKIIGDSSSDSSSDAVEIIEPRSSDKENSQIIDQLMKESVDLGDSPPSEKVVFENISSTDDEQVQESDDSEPILDKEEILEEQSQQVKKKHMRNYYKNKGLPVPMEYKSDSYSLDSESSYSD